MSKWRLCSEGVLGAHPKTTPETRKFFQQKKLPYSTRAFLSLSYFFLLKNAGTAPQSSSSVLIVGMDFLFSMTFFESDFEKLL